MICDWCGTKIDSYPQHFTHDDGADCRTAARIVGHQPVQRLDHGLEPGYEGERARIRNRTLNEERRTRKRDRLEDRVPTHVPWTQERQGRT